MGKLRKCTYRGIFTSEKEEEEGYFHQFGDMRRNDEDKPQTYAIIEDLKGNVHWAEVEGITFTNPPNPEDARAS